MQIGSNGSVREKRKRGLKFTWAAFARADSVDIELLGLMKEHGCDTVFFGVESGNQQMLDRIKKRVTLDRIRKAVADCKTVGMTVFASFIAGLPGETYDTLMDSHNFARELDVVYGYHFLAPFPGTQVKENISTYDLELLTTNWSQFDANRAIARTSSLSAKEIENFVDVHYLEDVRRVDAETERKYREGSLTGVDRLVYLGNKKLDVVFKLLSEDLIETISPDERDASATSPATRLAEKISALIDNPIEFIQMSIQHLIELGRLKYSIKGDLTYWQWT